MFGSAGAAGTGEGAGTGGEAGVTAAGGGTGSTGTLHTGSVQKKQRISANHIQTGVVHG